MKADRGACCKRDGKIKANCGHKRSFSYPSLALQNSSQEEAAESGGQNTNSGNRQIPSTPFSECLTLSKLQNISEPHFLHLKKGDNCSASPRGLL